MIVETKPPEILPATFWMTRDTVEGALSTTITVWSREPLRFRCEDGDILWLPRELIEIDEWIAFQAADVELDDPNLGSWTVDEALARVRTIPETDRECLRDGAAPAGAS